MHQNGPIGVFDSGYGGLTVFREIVKFLPEYDYVYLGDNARTPYGTRSFETVHEFTWQCVKRLFAEGCPLVILACNTASAKALRTIQKINLPAEAPDRRVLGVIRPTTEVIGQITRTGHVGILATPGTVTSDSYPTEIKKFFPEVRVFQEACPMWVPLVENEETNTEGADYFVKKNLDRLLKPNPFIDTVVLGCTHYPLLEKVIRKHLPDTIELISQGPLIAKGLEDYLARHPEIEVRCTQNGNRRFLTTDRADVFDAKATLFFGSKIKSERIHLD
jgi:glutamate racemase